MSRKHRPRVEERDPVGFRRHDERRYRAGHDATEDTIRHARDSHADETNLITMTHGFDGPFRLFARVAERWGLRFDVADLSHVDGARAVTRDNTRIIWVETPTNPLLNIADIAALAQLAHDRGALLVVDNTFASPYL